MSDLKLLNDFKYFHVICFTVECDIYALLDTGLNISNFFIISFKSRQFSSHFTKFKSDERRKDINRFRKKIVILLIIFKRQHFSAIRS